MVDGGRRRGMTWRGTASHRKQFRIALKRRNVEKGSTIACLTLPQVHWSGRVAGRGFEASTLGLESGSRGGCAWRLTSLYDMIPP